MRSLLTCALISVLAATLTHAESLPIRSTPVPQTTNGVPHVQIGANAVMALAAIEAGWAVAHPWAKQRAGWEGFVMIFTPNTQAELNVVLQLVRGSYTYVTGQSLPET